MKKQLVIIGKINAILLCVFLLFLIFNNTIVMKGTAEEEEDVADISGVWSGKWYAGHTESGVNGTSEYHLTQTDSSVTGYELETYSSCSANYSVSGSVDLDGTVIFRKNLHRSSGGSWMSSVTWTGTLSENNTKITGRYSGWSGSGAFALTREKNQPAQREYTYGIDVSDDQDTIDWQMVSLYSNINFTFVKATAGDDRKPALWEKKFESNMENATKNGIVAGAYHFAYPVWKDSNGNTIYNNAVDEAHWFLQHAKKYITNGYLIPALDLENDDKNKAYPSSLGKECLTQWVHDFMQTVESETGVRPIIYTGSDYADLLDDSIAQYDLWFPVWRTPNCNTDNPPTDQEIGIWKDNGWNFWQYYGPKSCGDNSNEIRGIHTPVDLDVYNGGMASLDNYVIKNKGNELNQSRNIMLTGFWNPTGQMIAQFSTDPSLNPGGWKGENWENLGYNIYSYFPTPETYTGVFQVDYQDTLTDFQRITDEIKPVAIISFGAGDKGHSWTIENNSRNLDTWENDKKAPTQPTPCPPDDSSQNVGYIRHSTLPVQAIENAVNTQTPVEAWVDWDGNPGAYLCEYMAYLGMQYQTLHNASNDPYRCLAAGFIHVKPNLKVQDAMKATNVTIREVIKTLQNTPSDNTDNKQPGFEFFVVISAIALVFLWKRKRRDIDF